MYMQGTASSVADFITQLNNFLTVNGSAFGVVVDGSGNGTLSGYRGGPSSRAERISLTAVTPTSFKVTGSLSGPLGTAFVGTAFDSPFCAFTLTAGSNAFWPGDVISFQTAPPWASMRAGSTGYIWKAPGNDGAQAIYMGCLPPASGAFLQLGGFTGYSAAAAFTAQPGYYTYNVFSQGLALNAAGFSFWLIADGRRVLIAAKPVAGNYQVAYMGFIDTYVDQVSYPYPLAVGTTALAAVAYTDTSYKNTAFLKSTYEQMMLRSPTGVSLRADGWGAYTINNQGTGGCYINPHSNSVMNSDALVNMRPNLDGTYPMFPLVLRDNTSKTMMGELAGVHCVPGSGLTPEQLLDFDGCKHLVLTNVARTTNSDYFTFVLD